MKTLIIGASSGIGRALAERLAARGDSLLLVSSDIRDLEALSSDLKFRHGVSVDYLSLDITDQENSNLVQFAADCLGSWNTIFMIAGAVSENDGDDKMQYSAIVSLAGTNFVAPAYILQAIMPLAAPKANIVVAGSVAAIRPRSVNTVYGASKRALEHVAMGLWHRHASRLSTVCCYRLGYVATSMTFGQKLLLPAISADQVAKMMISGVGRRSGVVYLPRWWKLVYIALIAMPWEIYKRLKI